jgi:vacuolar iron transporter family protein
LGAYNLKTKVGKEPTHSNFLSDFILGSQDGLVNVLGILLGLSAATSDIRLIFVAALAALGAESISMGAVAYTSTMARRKQYIKAMEKEKEDIKNLPNHSIAEIKKIFKNWGYKGKELEDLANKIKSNPEASLQFLVSFEHGFSPVDKSAPMRSFLTVLSSTIFGSAIPLIPFIFLSHNILAAAIGSVIISAITLFFIGYYEARTTVGSLWRSGLQMLIIGLTAGFAGYLIGHFVGAVPI